MRLMRLCDQHKLSGYRPHALAFLGWADCQVGRLEEGVSRIQAAVDAFDSVGYRLSVPAHLSNLADGLRRLGRLTEAKAASARAVETTVSGAAVWLEPEIRRVDALIDLELAPGEVLFVPVGWWHHVRALDWSITLSLTNFVFPNRYKWAIPQM